jgi:hypothetical protein
LQAARPDAFARRGDPIETYAAARYRPSRLPSSKPNLMFGFEVSLACRSPSRKGYANVGLYRIEGMANRNWLTAWISRADDGSAVEFSFESKKRCSSSSGRNEINCSGSLWRNFLRAAVRQAFSESHTLPDPTLYKGLAPKVGLLSSDLVLAITAFHEKYEEVRTWLPLMVEDRERKFSYSPTYILGPLVMLSETSSPL